MDEVTEQRIWKSLDQLSNQLSNIEKKIETVVRIEERVNNHDEVVARYGKRLDIQDNEIRTLQLWKANIGDRNELRSEIKNIMAHITTIDATIENIKTKHNIEDGQGDIVKTILKWSTSILAVVLTGMIMNGLFG